MLMLANAAIPAGANSSAGLVCVGILVIVAVLLHNLLGYIPGYAAARACGYSPAACRTTSVEIATQSAGLASGMGAKFFTPEAAISGVVAAVWHNIAGAIFAWALRRIPSINAEPMLTGNSEG